MKKGLLLSILVLILVSALAEGSCESSKQQGEITAGPGTPLSVTPDDPVEVYVMSSDGQPRLLTTLSSVPQWAWAPDDDHAALVTNITSYSDRIHVISVKAGTDIVTADIPITWSHKLAGNPSRLAWSPNGEWLAWESDSGHRVTLEAMRVDGSDRRNLAASDSNPSAEDGVVFGWKDDHTLLATVWESPNRLLYEFDLANGTEREVATQPEASWAEVSRDASRVVFVVGGERQGCYASSLWIMDVSDGSLHQVLSDTCQLEGAFWSPDGSQIAYDVVHENAWGTYILDLASGTSRKLGSSATLWDHVLGWSPDGSWIVVNRSRCPTRMMCSLPFEGLLVLISVASGDEKVISSRFPPIYVLSPNRGAVAFQEDGLQVAQIPSGPMRQVMPYSLNWRFDLDDSASGWSPDGQWFAFTRSRISTPTPPPSP